jgi:biopolymer transport protein ExbB
MDRATAGGAVTCPRPPGNALRWIRQWVNCSPLVIIGLSSSVAMAQDPVTKPNPVVSSGFFEIVFSGGVVGIAIMLSIFALSFVSVYLMIEQFMTLRRNEVIPPTLGEEVRQLLSQGRFPEAEQLCRNRPSPLSFVLISGLSEVDFGWSSMEKAMEDAVSEQAAKLQRKVEYLSVIGNLAPMLGLLGTVTGMILAFQQVAVSQGAAGPAQLAEGIYSALATTVAGLVVAIPSLGVFAVIRNRIDQLIAEIAYLAQHVFAPVRRRASKVTPRPVPPNAPPPRAP